MKENFTAYIEDTFIPNNIKKAVDFNDYGEEEVFYTISLRKIFNLAENDEEFIEIMKCLEKNNIRVYDLRNNLSLYDFPNYEIRKAELKHAKKPFTEEEQRAKFLEYAETKDQKVFNDIFEHNYRFILYIASKYSFIYRIPLDEAVSVACEGAMQAIKSYDVNRGVEFHNYAQKAMRSKLIYQQLDRYKRGKDTFLMDVLTAKLEKEKEYGMKIDDSLLGREMLEEVLDILVEKGDCVEEKKGKRRTKEDIRNLINIADHLNIDEVKYDEGESYLEESSYDDDLKEEIGEALNVINETEKKVLNHRYGLEDNEFKTLAECASFFGVTKQRINQVEKNAFQKIKRSKSSKRLKEFL